MGAERDPGPTAATVTAQRVVGVARGGSLLTNCTHFYTYGLHLDGVGKWELPSDATRSDLGTF